MKVNPWMELPLIDSLVIGKKAIVHAKMAHGRIEKHAYKVTSDGRLEMYDSSVDSSKKMYNPKIRGNPIIDFKGRLVFKWDETKPEYADSLFDFDSFEERKNYDDLLEQTYNAGMSMGALKARGGGRKSLMNDPLFLAMAAVLLITIVNIVLTYVGLDSLGAVFLGGTGGKG